MDFDLPEELQILRDTVWRFVDKELIPLEREYRHDAERADAGTAAQAAARKNQKHGALDAGRIN